METFIDVLEIILQWLFVSFAIMAAAAFVLLKVNLDPQVTRLATDLQAHGVGQFLLYFFIICAIIAHVSNVILKVYKSVQSPSRDSL